jgi:Methyl-accepting chemotaxis protein (MCP) signalling domain
MRRIGLTGRIWLSLGVFVLGYLFSVAVAQVQGLRAEGGLKRTSEALFPAAQRTQQAEASFERMSRAFSDAVMLEDLSALDKADEAGKEVATLLTAAASTPQLSPERAERMRQLAALATGLMTSGRETYTAMVKSGTAMTEAMQARGREVAARSEQLKTGLAQMREQTAKDLQDQLASGVTLSIQQRWLGAVVFVITLAVAGTVVVLTIRRAVVGVLRSVVVGLREGASQIVSAAGQVASSSQSLSQGASEQAGSLQESSNSLTEMAEMTRISANHAQEAAKVVAQVHASVDESNHALKRMVVSMAGIDESSQKVAHIARTIEEIAFQTNLLALNAAVEAARAGEAGMGFAVVADEVRNLAQRASQAAKDTAMLIEQSIANTSQGRQDVQQVVKSVTTITTGVDKVKSLVEEVSSSTRQQAHGIDSVAEAVARISKVTQMTAATAEESAAASEELNAQAESAMDEVRRLDALVSGGHDTTAAPAADMFAPTPTAAEIISMPMPGALSAQGAAQGASRQRRTVAAISAR